MSLVQLCHIERLLWILSEVSNLEALHLHLSLIWDYIFLMYKKGNRSEKGNYRPVCILPNISKVFERCVYKQMPQFFEVIIFKYQCSFRKGYSAQHAFISFLEKRRYNIDLGRMFRALLTDLSKAFDCLPHYIIIAKLKMHIGLIWRH